MQLRGAWNCDDPGLLTEDPRQCDLGRRCLLSLGNLADQVDQGLVRLAGLWVEARDCIPKVAAVECGVLVDLARKEALAQRAEGNEADAKLLKGGHHLCLGLSPPKRVLALEGGDGRTAWARRIVRADAFERPKCLTLPCWI